MKPTKEQLADPKWWDENSKGYDYIFYLERNDEYKFADAYGDGVNFRLIIDKNGWELLAKRPEPEWVPEVGEWCMRGEKGSKHSYKVFMIGYNSKGFPVFESLPHHDSITCDTGCYEYKPIKTQREKLIDIVKVNLDMGITPKGIADAILARFDLTEKDGE